MPEQKKSTRYIMVIVGLVAGFAAGWYLATQKFADQQSAQTQKLQQQIDRARKLFPSVPSDIHSFSGKITAVNGNAITFEPSYFNPFEDLPKSRTVTVDQNTKIVRLVPKDQKTLQQEMAAFQQQIGKKQGVLPAPPTLTNETPAALADLHVGNSITVRATENIRDKTTFTAAQIQINAIK